MQADASGCSDFFKRLSWHAREEKGKGNWNEKLASKGGLCTSYMKELGPGGGGGIDDIRQPAWSGFEK